MQNIDYNAFNTLSAYVGATAAFNTMYASYSTSSGFSAGWSAGISPQMGFPISTNITSVGANYNITNNSLSGNVSAWDVSKSGWSFDPSVSAMFLEEQSTNLVRGQGFRSNQKVYENIMFSAYNHPEINWRQEVLDYFGFKGTYDPDYLDPAGFNADTKSITFGPLAFGGTGNSYSRLRAIYEEEVFHSKDYLTYKSKMPVGISNEHAYEEFRAQVYLYKNQGLYSKSGIDWGQRINGWGSDAGINPDIIFKYNFYRPWWHFIYQIPRKW